MKALFDTNVLIDYLVGVDQAKAELALYPDKAISIVSWMEVQVGTTPADQQLVDDFLRAFAIIPLDAPVSLRAVAVRKATGMKLPDAIILATAQAQGRLLVTRNSKDFSPGHPGVRVPYIL